MKVLTKNLLPALEFAKGSVGRSIPILSCVLIEADGNNGTLRVKASDIDQTSETICDCEGGLEAVCVSVRQLAEFAAIAGEAIEFDQSKKGRLTLSSGASVELSTLPADQFPAAFKDQYKGAGVNCADLTTAVRSVKWAASKDVTRYVLQSVYIKATPKMLICMSSSGRELARYSMPAICSEFELLVPDAFSVNLCRALESEGSEIHVGKNSVMVKHNSGSYTCKLIEDKFPSRAYSITEQQSSPIGEVGRDEWLQTFKAIREICPVPPANELAVSAIVEFSPKSALVKSKRENFKFDRVISGKFSKHIISVNVESVGRCFLAFPAESNVKIATSTENNFVSFESGNLKIVASLYQVPKDA